MGQGYQGKKWAFNKANKTSKANYQGKHKTRQNKAKNKAILHHKHKHQIKHKKSDYKRSFISKTPTKTP